MRRRLSKRGLETVRAWPVLRLGKMCPKVFVLNGGTRGPWTIIPVFWLSRGRPDGG